MDAGAGRDMGRRAARQVPLVERYETHPLIWDRVHPGSIAQLAVERQGFPSPRPNRRKLGLEVDLVLIPCQAMGWATGFDPWTQRSPVRIGGVGLRVLTTRPACQIRLPV